MPIYKVPKVKSLFASTGFRSSVFAKVVFALATYHDEIVPWLSLEQSLEITALVFAIFVFGAITTLDRHVGRFPKSWEQAEGLN